VSTEAQQRRIEELEAQLQEANELLEAIRSGEVDAVVVSQPDGGEQIYTLRDADRPYRVLIEQMREGAMTLAADGVVLFANSALGQILGRRTDDIVGHPFASFLSADPINERFANVLAGGVDELALQGAGSAVVPVQIAVSDIPPTMDGDLPLRCAIVTDLTAEKRRAREMAEFHAQLAAEAARREGEGFARLIIDSSTDYAIIATDRSARTTTWNTGATNIFGWTAEEMIGTTAERIWTEEDRAAGVAEAERERALETGRAEDERWHLRHDGTRFFASGLMMPLRGADDEHLGFLKILRDRTSSRRIEAALQESESRLRFALSAGRLGSWELDLLTGELITTETCRSNFGRPVTEPFTYEQLRESVYPDDRARMAAGVEEAIANHTDYDIEYRLLTPAGELRWVQIRGRPIYRDDGTPQRMVGVSVDITERRLAAEQLQRLNESLETKVIHEAATRSSAEEALRQSQKMEAVGQLTGGVAHDFNNLLTVIKSSTDFLARPNLSAERQARYIGAISDTVDRAAKLTSQLLAFARRQALKPEVFDVADRIRSIGDMLRTIVGSRVEIVTSFKVDHCLVDADASQFDTALVNIVVNARDAMEGSGRLVIVVDAVEGVPAIRAHAGGSGAFIVVRISDTGSGIPPEKLPHIFEPFYTTKEVGKGTGLGLSQVYGFAKQSGGDVDVSSDAGRGATFTLYLPRAEGPLVSADDQAANADLVPEEGGGLRVLVVEDNVEVGAFSTQLLQDLGYRTFWAPSGRDALKMLEADPAAFDIVFTDVVMPGISGVELGLEIRRRYPALPVVLTSGYSNVLAEEGRQGFELVQKPYAVEHLSRILRRVLRAR
jgi:PAS domain S-box-containing protein